ncbi:MAG TPA: hypothetical protein VFT16_00195 [Candidatus Saccharimonadales bacterium]|nr:hypothetical protein [Candidatus Saccharimonadales bacterium]
MSVVIAAAAVSETVVGYRTLVGLDMAAAGMGPDAVDRELNDRLQLPGVQDVSPAGAAAVQLNAGRVAVLLHRLTVGRTLRVGAGLGAVLGRIHRFAFRTDCAHMRLTGKAVSIVTDS